MHIKQIKVCKVHSKVSETELVERLSRPLFGVCVSLPRTSRHLVEHETIVHVGFIDKKDFFQWFSFYQGAFWKGIAMELIEMSELTGNYTESLENTCNQNYIIKDTSNEHNGFFSLHFPERDTLVNDKSPLEFKFHVEPKICNDYTNHASISPFFMSMNDPHKPNKCLVTWKDNKDTISKFCREKFRNALTKKGPERFSHVLDITHNRDNSIYVLHNIQRFTMKQENCIK